MVLIIIVNYKVGDLTIDCLSSLEGEVAGLSNSRVVVVDNDSQDGSAETILQAITTNTWNNWATLITAEKNGGFAAGNNLGIRHGWKGPNGSTPDFVLLLNPDTVVRPGALRLLVDFLQSHPDVGIAGGRSEDPDTTPQYCCFRFPNAWNEFAANAKLGFVDRVLKNKICRVPFSNEPHPIDWVSGAFMLVRAQIFDQIGLFDENFFLYYEETDFIHRARKAGWLCWHVPQSRIVHLVGHSSGVTIRHQRPRRKPVYWFDSRRRYFLKQQGLFHAALADLMAIFGVALGRTREILLRRPTTFPPWFLWDCVRNSVRRFR